MNDARYTIDVGTKFERDGRVRDFPGNTTVAMVAPDTAAYRLGEWVQQRLTDEPYGHKFALLPPDSFHMTTMELLCDAIRTPERWSAALPLDATLAETDRFFISQMQHVETPTGLRMAYDGLSNGRGLLIMLRPADEPTAAALHTYREQVAQATGVRFPDHDTYRFHMSLAYRILHLTEAEQHDFDATCAGWDAHLRQEFGVLHLPAPRLSFFDDMFAFLPVEAYARLRTR